MARRATSKQNLPLQISSVHDRRRYSGESGTAQPRTATHLQASNSKWYVVAVLNASHQSVSILSELLTSCTTGGLWRCVHVGKGCNQMDKTDASAQANFAHWVCMGHVQSIHCYHRWVHHEQSCNQEDGVTWRHFPIQHTKESTCKYASTSLLFVLFFFSFEFSRVALMDSSVLKWTEFWCCFGYRYG